MPVWSEDARAFFIKEDGVHYEKWVISRSMNPANEKPWLLMSSQRCCLWNCPTWQDAVDLMLWFAEMCRSPRLVEPRSPHIRHMRNGVVFPMKREEFSS